MKPPTYHLRLDDGSVPCGAVASWPVRAIVPWARFVDIRNRSSYHVCTICDWRAELIIRHKTRRGV